MSHELRTPLNAILGFSEAMKSELLGPVHNRSYREYAASIHDSGRHLLQLINQILDLSRIEAGRCELSEEAVRLAGVVEDCLRLLNLRVESKGLNVAVVCDRGLDPLWADARAVRQICLNLISNALKFTPRGGHVTITVADTPEGGQMLVVKDSGPGIPKEEIPRVMQAFGQGSLAHRIAEGGTGLGLSIVQSLVAAHGGTFELRSALRKGTEAIVRLPPSRRLHAALRPSPRDASGEAEVAHASESDRGSRSRARRCSMRQRQLSVRRALPCHRPLPTLAHWAHRHAGDSPMPPSEADAVMPWSRRRVRVWVLGSVEMAGDLRQRIGSGAACGCRQTRAAAWR
jgi:two-component system cell cycle sensor histidine kinase PleC